MGRPAEVIVALWLQASLTFFFLRSVNTVANEASTPEILAKPLPHHANVTLTYREDEEQPCRLRASLSQQVVLD